jgi:hypothetical protein
MQSFIESLCQYDRDLLRLYQEDESIFEDRPDVLNHIFNLAPPTTESLVVFRGIDLLSATHTLQTAITKVTSTSASCDVAKRYSSSRSANSHRSLVLKINIPAGSKVLNLGGAEQEILLPPVGKLVSYKGVYLYRQPRMLKLLSNSFVEGQHNAEVSCQMLCARVTQSIESNLDDDTDSIGQGFTQQWHSIRHLYRSLLRREQVVDEMLSQDDSVYFSAYKNMCLGWLLRKRVCRQNDEQIVEAVYKTDHLAMSEFLSYNTDEINTVPLDEESGTGCNW